MNFDVGRRFISFLPLPLCRYLWGSNFFFWRNFPKITLPQAPEPPICLQETKKTRRHARLHTDGLEKESRLFK
ncbi:MAG TPA: hypothetical protein DEB39_15980 [Planctomycetaceae bacterium]|nr:hypothetical protein [Planctomycetaceae bacterium]